MKQNQQERLYSKYISTHIGSIYEATKNDFEVYHKYFEKNYSRYITNDKNIKILDIGCGMGHFLYYLQKEGYENNLGIDASAENIEFCKIKGFKVEHNDVFNFFKSNVEPFDIIVMNDVIEHFNKEEIISILDLIHKNLVENGKLIIKTINSSNPIMANSSRYLDFTHEIGFTEESLSQILKICDFKDVSIYPQNIYIFYFNPLNYIAKFFSILFNFIFRLIFLLYGRKSTKIFTKDIIAVAIK